MVDLFGHRGAAGEAPENTLAGYRFAWGLGVRCLELDVHLTRDGELAVIHDEVLDRTTNGKGHVGGYTMAELKGFDAGFLYGGTFPDARIPTLDEVFSEFAAMMRLFQLEIKTDRPFILDIVCKKVGETLLRFGIADKVVVTSFDPYAIRTMKKVLPRQRCGLISMQYRESDLRLAKELGCWNTCIPLKTGGSADLVRKAHALGLEVTGWLGNSTADVDILLEWGTDSITSNYPSIVLPYLKSKNLLRDAPLAGA
ncbi:MAG: glycerophosphodiester phosphodiesterase family protein [Spirochaetes bacterium]|nr:glycerophosphodiester phosphodiesterase family protein [Spirochaetota bacterium]